MTVLLPPLLTTAYDTGIGDQDISEFDIQEDAEAELDNSDVWRSLQSIIDRNSVEVSDETDHTYRGSAFFLQ